MKEIYDRFAGQKFKVAQFIVKNVLFVSIAIIVIPILVTAAIKYYDLRTDSISMWRLSTIAQEAIKGMATYVGIAFSLFATIVISSVFNAQKDIADFHKRYMELNSKMSACMLASRLLLNQKQRKGNFVVVVDSAELYKKFRDQRVLLVLLMIQFINLIFDENHKVSERDLFYKQTLKEWNSSSKKELREISILLKEYFREHRDEAGNNLGFLSFQSVNEVLKNQNHNVSFIDERKKLIQSFSKLMDFQDIDSFDKAA